MEISRVQPMDVHLERLDAEFYRSEYLQTEKSIRSIGSISTFEQMRRDDIPIRRGIDMPTITGMSADPVLVTIASFQEPGIDFEDLERVSVTQHNAFKGSHLQPGDLVVAMGGYPGRAAICPTNTPPSNIGRHSARVVIDTQKADRYFVWTFITSRYGKIQFGRQITGSVQAGINIEDLRLIELPAPHPDAQHYIGSKVRQAEGLRERGRVLQRKTQLDIAAITQFSEDSLQNVLPTNHIQILANRIGDRLDASFYRPVFLILEDKLKEAGAIPLSSLCKRIECGPFGGNAIAGNLYEDNGIPFIRPVNITSNRFNYSDLVTVSKQTLHSAGLKVYDGECLLFGRVGNPCVGLFQGQFSISPNIVLAEIDPDLADVSFLHAFCSSKVGIHQLLRQLKMVAQPTTPTDAVRELLVILPDPKTQKRIGAANRAFDLTMLGARQLVTAARLLVEALIERKITEQDLSDAGKSKEADRALLARLRQDGVDGAGAIVFPDLDVLETLLAEANNMGSSL